MKRLLFTNLLFFSTFLFAQEISNYKFQCKYLLSKSGKLFLNLENDQSIKLANEALNLAIHNNDDEIAAKAYNLIGLNYSDFLEINKAIDAYKKGLNRANKTNNDTIKSWLTNNLANAYCYNEVDFHEGIKYYKLALKFAQKLNYEHEAAFTKLNLVSALFRVSNYQEGIGYLLETKDFVDLTDDVEAKITFNSLYADYFNNEKNDFDKAEEYYLKALNYSKNNETEFIQSHIANLFKDISNFYSKHKKFEEAFLFSKMSDSLNTMIYNADRIERVANISKDLEKIEVERNLFEIKQKKDYKKKNLKQQKLSSYSLL